MTNKITIVILALAALVVGALLWVTLGGDPVPERKPTRAKKTLIQDAAPAKKSVKKDAAKAKPAKVAAQKEKRKKAKKAFHRKPVVDTYSPADRKLADAVQAALDDDNFEQTRKAALAAMKSENPEVRQEAVDALGWFDTKAIADLTVFLGDRNGDVAESAFNHWDSAVDMVEDEGFKVTIAREAMKSLKDPDMLENVSSKLKAAEDEGAAVDAVVDILRNVGEDSAAAKIAKESYEFITGEEYKSVSAATLWKVKKAQEERAESEAL